MTRVSTSMMSQNALLDLQRAQKSLFDASGKTASQTKATDMKGYGSSTHNLISGQRLQARLESRIDKAAELETRMSLQDVALERAATQLDELRETILNDISLNAPSSIDQKLKETFLVLKDSFNTQIAGNYLFGGTLNSQAPVQSANLADLAANPLADAFVQGAQEQKVSVDGFQEISLAPVAANVASDAFSFLRDLQNNGPYDPLTDAQKTYLQGQLSTLSTVTDGLINLQAQNGRTQESIQLSVDSQQLQLNSLSISISEITSVDLAEVALQLRSAETAYQASASVFSRLSQMTLLDVL